MASLHMPMRPLGTDVVSGKLARMKTVVITGGSEGLGRAIAEYLHDTYKVYILARTEKTLEQTAKEIGCEYRVCDVTDYAKLEGVLADIAKDAGSVDVLINNAGLWIQGALEDNDAGAIKEAIDVNVTGVINGTKAAIPHMKQQGSGTIIQINSQGGFVGKAERSVYNASKWAITGFTKSIQPELEPHNIKVTGIYPTMMHTELFSKQGIEKDMNKALSTKEVAKTIKFLLEMEDTTMFYEIGIKKMGY